MKKMMFTKDDTKIFYDILGSGEPLLFLHGNGQSNRYFSQQVRAFSKKYRLYLMDTRDHGRSNNQQNYLDIPLIIGDIVQLMLIEQLETVKIIGFSDGANIALTFACQYPERVTGLVLASPNLTATDLNSGQRWRSELFRKLSDKLHLYKFSRLTQLALADLPISEGDIKKITCPVLVIGGSHDIIPVSHLIHIASLLPEGELEIANRTGHSVPFLRAKWFNQRVLYFLENIKKEELS